MQGSIQGPLLRSGQNSAYKALGQTGFPVYRMATQLLEAIRRLDGGHQLARHLAIPQSDQGGDRTDWYSSFPGEVIPWVSATETERAAAYQQFDGFKLAVESLSERLLTADDKGAGGDRRAFASLLRQVLHFPDQHFVYLVDGVLVITFWGFIHHNGEQRDPMHWLRVAEPASIPSSSSSSSSSSLLSNEPVSGLADAYQHTVAPDLAQGMPYSQPVVLAGSAGSWWHWRWLRWPLLLLLLLSLLLFGLRACAPGLSLPGFSPAGLSLPGFSSTGLSLPAKDVGVTVSSPGVSMPAVTGSGLSGSAGSDNGDLAATAPGLAAAGASAGSGATGAPPVSPPAGESPASASQEPVPSAPASTDGAAPADGQGAAPSLAPPELPAVPQPAVPDNAAPADPAPQGKALVIPPAIPDGRAHFLDGDWKVNGGIQDKQNGKPLQLQYSFDDGKGKVSLRQSNGVECQGVANGVMNHGRLTIDNQGQANCSDGSTYMMPKIECQSGTASGTDCVGLNDGEQQFPIKMRQKNP